MLEARSEPYPTTNRWYVLALLTAIMTVHHIDRNVMAVIVEPVRREFGLSDGAMGVLTGLAHSTALAVFILPLGWLVDRVNRVRLIGLLVVMWSGLTTLGATAQGYLSLFAIRAGVGAAEAGGSPASVSIISDSFSARERPTALGLYYVHVALGTGLIFLLGGYVAQHHGWRAAFLLAGLPGLLLGILLLLTIREPRRETVHAAPPRVAEMLRALGGNRPLQFMLAAGATATIAQTAVWAWMSAFFMRAHGLSLVQVGLVVAAAAGVGKGLGSVLSGPAMRLLARDRASAMWRFPALMLVSSVPIAWAMVFAPATAEAIVAGVALGVVLGCWAAPATAILISVADPRMRGSATSAYQLACNLIGAGGGPLLTGLLSDLMGGGAALGAALALSMTVNIASAVFFYAACRSNARRESAAQDGAAID